MENPIEKWINEDKDLYNLVVEIQSMNKTEIEQAEIAFNKLCELYDLPKMPNDLERYEEYYENNDVENPRSVFEEHALLKYLEPNNDPRGLVLSAIYHVKNGFGVEYEEIAEKEFGEEVPENLQIGIKGSGINGVIVFPLKEGKSWFDLGCIVNTKLV
ncbi:hypothetical protein [Nonlabens sp. Asnod3-H03]|uniref:hypothetical protein n=1 Tax=Nonlabens sp. Asnod3-H03 TaxID=3160580 RepID=UPI00386B7B36